MGSELVAAEEDAFESAERAADGLTPLQVAWAEAYVGGAKWSPTEAVRLAGYAEGTNRIRQGYDNLKHPKIRRYVKALLAAAADETLISRSRIVEEASAVAYSDITEILDLAADGTVVLTEQSLRALPAPARRAIRKIKVNESPDGKRTFELEFYDKLKALQILGALGIATESDKTDDSLFTGLQIIAPLGSKL